MLVNSFKSIIMKSVNFCEMLRLSSLIIREFRMNFDNWMMWDSSCSIHDKWSFLVCVSDSWGSYLPFMGFTSSQFSFNMFPVLWVSIPQFEICVLVGLPHTFITKIWTCSFHSDPSICSLVMSLGIEHIIMGLLPELSYLSYTPTFSCSYRSFPGVLTRNWECGYLAPMCLPMTVSVSLLRSEAI